MSDNPAPEPEDQVDELIDDLEVHAVREGGSLSVEWCVTILGCEPG
ncbi:hypothetical protein [Nonomuraea sp. NPDC050310]